MSKHLDVTSLAALTPTGEFAIPKGTGSTKPSKPCGCGCGTHAKPGSHFLQGHDQRLKGMILRVATGKCYEGERERLAAILATKHPGHNSSTFVALIAKLPKVETKKSA